MVLRKGELQGQNIKTIYFGGGTPSILTIDEIQLLIETVYKNYSVIDNPEITLEANPDDLTNKRINELTDTQINRLSIGIQSFFDDDLQSMNRAHNVQDAKNCLHEAAKHFNNISIDLIYGIPNMTIEKWNENLQITFGFDVKHISSYALTVEPKTALDVFIKKGTYPPLDETLALQHFNHLIKETKKQGFVQYEISNFGKPDYFSKHNTSYWQGSSYLGIGPSAHSFDGKIRGWNVSNNSKYIQAIRNNELPITIETLSKKDHFNEYIMTGLRTIWGISLDKIETEFGVNYKNHLISEVQKYIDKDLIIRQNDVFQITKKGKFLADGIASDLFMI